MSDFYAKYPQPVRLSDSAYDANVPRSIQDDIDYMEAQQKRIFYLDNRVERLEQLLRNREHSVEVFKQHVELLETSRESHVRTIDEKNKDIIRLEKVARTVDELKAHIKGLETDNAIRAKAKKAFLKKHKK